QAHGAKINGKISGSIGDLGCFSFYPTKNLSAFGDAGMVTTNSKKLYRKLLELRDCGRSKKRYLHNIIGYNSRLDNIQASYLRLKLKQINKWTDARIHNANIYSKPLKETKGLVAPFVPKDFKHVFHVYSIRTKKRKKLMQEFSRNKIPCSVFYPLPLHLQKANRYLGYKRGDFPVAEKISKEILAIPVHPNLKKEDVVKIVSIIKRVQNG
ncbi:MAG: DegT/DnrJ/EryC1/StrS family aminotransferase, partial [Candidatus Omnitrophica bacterium]|nr:DegT/DnrJ/EryC1/StrS family aminotransferase [Candidatus Omnitrophota bacterium]